MYAVPVAVAAATIVFAKPSPAAINEVPNANAVSVTRISSSKKVSLELPSSLESS